MAQAIPELEREYEEKMFSHTNGDLDSEDEDENGDIGAGPAAGPSSGASPTHQQNGYGGASRQRSDRFGFIGGDQFTDPDQ